MKVERAVGSYSKPSLKKIYWISLYFLLILNLTLISSGYTEVILFEENLSFSAENDSFSFVISFTNETLFENNNYYQLLIINDSSFPVGTFNMILSINENLHVKSYDEYRYNETELACAFSDEYFASEKGLNSNADTTAKFNLFGFIQSNINTQQCILDQNILEIKLIIFYHGETESALALKLVTSDIEYGKDSRPTDILTTNSSILYYPSILPVFLLITISVKKSKNRIIS
ncbi:MAG: hypothetical protein INQ03_21375 [Candidatus Heimdallarchaeota archaeon]|nr:hypothetical protein [Candidatus Heimdallarchaeota archaeon]